MSSLVDVKRLSKKVFGDGEPRAFADLLQVLFAATIFKDGQMINAPAKDRHGNLTIGSFPGTFVLRDVRFLKFFMRCSIKPFSVITSCFQYQLDTDLMSDKFVFQYDYDRHAKPRHPSAHLQINGVLNEQIALLPDVRFPVARPSIESMIALLINDFGITPRDPEWQEVLDESERAFKRYQAEKIIESMT